MTEFEYVFVILSLRLFSKRLALRAVTRETKITGHHNLLLNSLPALVLLTCAVLNCMPNIANW